MADSSSLEYEENNEYWRSTFSTVSLQVNCFDALKIDFGSTWRCFEWIRGRQ